MKNSSRQSVLLFLVFLNLPTVFCKLTQKVKDTEVKVGSSTFLNCSTDDPSREIRWFHYRVGETTRMYVYVWGAVQPPYNTRFEMEIDRESGAFNVVIRSTSPDDAGRYLCWDAEEKGDHSIAELVVLESDPICVSNIRLDELVGENSCGVKQDDIELKCSVKYHGNRGPQLTWKSMESPNQELVQNGSSIRGVTSMSMTLTAIVSLIGSSFICEAQNEVFRNLSCNTTIKRVFHASENKAEISVVQNTEVLCEANTNCQSCSYSWHDDRGHQVSASQNLTAKRLGSHQCKAKCRLRNQICEFVAKHIYVNLDGSKGLDQTLWLLVLFAVLVAVIILVAFLYTKHKRNTTNQIADVQRMMYASHPEKVSYRDDPIPVPTTMGISSFSSSSPSSSSHIRQQQQQSQLKVRGVTVLGQSVFAVYSNSQEIQVFDSKDYSESRLIDIRGLVDPWDIVSSPSDNCLYVMDGKAQDGKAGSSIREVLRVNPAGDVILDWPTKKDAGYLSVTALEGNVILAVYKKNLFKEFSPMGELVRKVRVSATGGRIIHPHHAFKLTTGHYLVIHGIGDSLHRVCIVNDQGDTLKTFGGRKGCTDALMNLPKYLAVDRAGSVMVLDQNNNRVLLLNFDLSFKKVLIGNDKGLENPCRIHLDEVTGHLLVTQPDCVRVFDVLQMDDNAADGATVWDSIV